MGKGDSNINPPAMALPAFPITQPDFKKYVTYNSSNQTTSNPSFLKRALLGHRSLNFSLFPRVYASDSITNDTSITAEQGESKTQKVMTDEDVKAIPVLVTDEEVVSVIKKETGMDRLREMFARTEKPTLFGRNTSPELGFVMHIAESVLCVGFVFGMSRGARTTAEDRMTKHLTVRYQHKVTAQRRFIDAVLIKGVKLGFFYGLAAGAFTGTFMLMSQCIAVYRNRSSFIEYTIAGGTAALLSRLHIGPRAMLSGGVLGASLGTIGGCIIYAGLKFTNETQEQQRYWRVYEHLRHEKQVRVMASEQCRRMEDI